jgi:SsrA-binding protein
MKKKSKSFVCTNRKARFEYFVEDTFVAGISLLGHEVRSVREGKMSISESFIQINGTNVILTRATIQPNSAAVHIKYNPTRDRALLLNKNEIMRLNKKINEKGYTIIPLDVHRKNGLFKLTIGLAKGKNQRDKREDIKKRDMERDLRREI